MYKKVIIPLDMSDLGEQVFKAVKEVTTPKRSQLILVHCLEPQKYAVTSISDDPKVQDKLLGDFRVRAVDYLKSQQALLQSQGYATEIRIGQGDAAQYVVDVAVEDEADLIAMTTHGRTGFLRTTLGSVADRVIRTAHQPVLLVRSTKEQGTSHPIQNILVPIDGSAVAKSVLSQAQKIAEESGATITLLQVLEPMQMWEKQLAYGPGRPFEEIAEIRKEKASSYLAETQNELESSQFSVNTKLYEGGIAESILDVASEDDVDLIVMGTHGHGGAARWLFGSVANRVLHNATCPLLVIRQRHDLEEGMLLSHEQMLNGRNPQHKHP